MNTQHHAERMACAIQTLKDEGVLTPDVFQGANEALAALSAYREAARGEWVCAGPAALALGVHKNTLFRWRTSGHLEPGKHWRRLGGPKGQCTYNIHEIQSQMSEWATVAR
jgi:hypothetical protein